MKTSFLLLCLFPLFLQAQNRPNRQPPQELPNLHGQALIDKALELSDAFYKNEQYERAEQLARRAFGEAAKMENHLGMAMALNREARAMVKNPRSRLFQKGEAIGKFQESLEMMEEHGIENEALRQDNQTHLQKAAEHFAQKFNPAEVDVLIGAAFDSAIGKMEHAGIVVDIPPTPQQPPTVVKDKWQAKKDKRHAEWEQKLVEQQKRLLEYDVKRKILPKIPGDVELPEAEALFDSALVEVQQLWPQQKQKIESELEKEFQRVEGMKPEDVKDELLLAHYKNQYDSLAHEHRMDSVNLAKQAVELKRKEAVIASQNARRSLFLVGSGSTLALSFFLLLGYRQQRKNNRLLSVKNVEIEQEQKRSEELLLNILPANVAKELKQYGEAHAHRYDSVSVLFSDFQNFSRIAEKLPPEKLVAELDYCFKAFDGIVEKYQLEKIKTIGDAYMCAGGLGNGQAAGNGEGENFQQKPAVNSVKAALEMQQFLANWKEEKQLRGEDFFEARIGIHTGAIVAGVVGLKKFAYDIWGDTVNTASRMETNSAPGKVNISESTHELVKDAFQCAYRGKIQVKNKGEVDMYFVEN